jgi:peptidoglycan/LPS O-acetylase OafA/YrhL
MVSPAPATIALDSSLPNANPRRHISGLALLRGLAALSVGLYHYTGAVLPKLRVPEIQAVFKSGWLGVEVFFVISGFVIPYSLLGKNYSLKKFFPYIIKRIVRINPPAYLAMLLVLMQWYLIDYFISHHVSYTRDVTVGRLFNNILFTVPFSEQSWVIGIFWTLAIEFQFYLFIGLLFNLLFEKECLIWFILIFILVNLVQHLPFKSSENFFHFSSLFALGGLTLFRHQGRISNLSYLVLLVLFTGLAYFEIGLYQAITGLVTALAIYYLKVENKFTRFLGDISFSFYLVHAVIGTTCEFILIKFIPVGPVINRIVLLLICIGVSIVGSYLFYLVVERPFMRLASRLRV